jgi:hypothetical protein
MLMSCICRCGLYCKLHGSAHPISMKSDIIRKRSRHDACAQCSLLTDPPSASNTLGTPSKTPSQTQTPSGSPGVSHCPIVFTNLGIGQYNSTYCLAQHECKDGRRRRDGGYGYGSVWRYLCRLQPLPRAVPPRLPQPELGAAQHDWYQQRHKQGIAVLWS